MLITKCIPLACAIGLGLLFVPSRRPALPRLDAPLAVPAARVIPSPPGNAFGEALREAKAWRMQAREAAKQEQEAWEARDPQGAAIADADAWRRGLLARDHGSFLRRARAQARRAAALARTPAEAARAAELLVLLECDAGHHATELRQAQRLVALQHGSYRSLTVLRRAAVCNGRTALARQTSAALEALETKSDARAGAPAPQDAPDRRDRPSDRR